MKLVVKILLVIVGLAIYVIISNLPYLPGPDGMASASNMCYTLVQLFSVFSYFLLPPIGVIWLIIILLRKQGFCRIPIYIAAIPILYFASNHFLTSRIRDLSRNRTIVEAEPLINAINKYNESESNYPADLRELVPNYMIDLPKPTSMGIDNFEYRNQGEKYEIEFDQNVIMSFNIEIVIFDPTGTFDEGWPWEETGFENWKYYTTD